MMFAVKHRPNMLLDVQLLNHTVLAFLLSHCNRPTQVMTQWHVLMQASNDAQVDLQQQKSALIIC